MPKKDGLTDALDRSRNHLGGDKTGADASKPSKAQEVAAGASGDKPVGRTEFILGDEEVEALRQARAADAALPQGTEVKPDENERAFWVKMGADWDFIPTTVDCDPADPERFTAWPVGSDPRAIAAEDMVLDTGRLEQAAEVSDMDIATLAGDVRDTLLDIFRNRQKPWDAHSQDEKRDLSKALDYVAKLVVRRAVMLLAADGRPAIQATLDKFTNKGGGEIVGTITVLAAQDETLLALHHATGKTVMLVTADADAYTGQRKEPVGPDQPALEFEAGTDKPPIPDDDSDLAGGGGKEDGDEEE